MLQEIVNKITYDPFYTYNYMGSDFVSAFGMRIVSGIVFAAVSTKIIRKDLRFAEFAKMSVFAILLNFSGYFSENGFEKQRVG